VNSDDIKISGAPAPFYAAHAMQADIPPSLKEEIS
jgi:hypothetical protein